MANNNPITAEYLRSRLDYDSVAGTFMWKPREVEAGSHWTVRSWNGKYAGKPAGKKLTVRSATYISICLDNKQYLAHRLAWLYVHGVWPADQIDHIDRDPSNNRIVNLRPATASQNQANRSSPRNRTSGIRGVTFASANGRWCAKIQAEGKSRNLGYFDSLEDAATAYRNAADRLFGEFAAT